LNCLKRKFWSFVGYFHNPRLSRIKKKLVKFCPNFYGLNFLIFLNIVFWCAPFGYLYFLSFQLLNEPGLGAGINPGMALTPFPSSIG